MAKLETDFVDLGQYQSSCGSNTLNAQPKLRERRGSPGDLKLGFAQPLQGRAAADDRTLTSRISRQQVLATRWLIQINAAHRPQCQKRRRPLTGVVCDGGRKLG